MPQVSGGPRGLNAILEGAYASARSQGHDKGRASQIAWGAAKHSYKKKGGKWVEKMHDDLSGLAMMLQSEVLKSPSSAVELSKLPYLVFALQKIAELTESGSDMQKSVIEHLGMGDVEENPLNREIDRGKVDGIKRSVEETGSVKPLVYVEIDKDGAKSKMITDGHHRLVALKELGYGSFPARVSDERGTDTAADDLPVKLRKEVASADVVGLGLVREDLHGKPKKKTILDVVVKFIKGGPGSGRHPGDPHGRSDELDVQIARHKNDLKAGKIDINTFTQRTQPLYNLKNRTSGATFETVKPVHVPVEKAWSDEAREASIEARRSGAKGNKAFAEPFHSGNHVKQFLGSNDIVIGSVDKGHLSPEKNALRQKEFEATLDKWGLPYKKGNGVSSEWGNETSYIIHAPRKEDADSLQHFLTSQYKQDAVIHVRNGHAVMNFSGGTNEPTKHANVGVGLEAGDHLDDNYTSVDGQRFKINFK